MKQAAVFYGAALKTPIIEFQQNSLNKPAAKRACFHNQGISMQA